MKITIFRTRKGRYDNYRPRMILTYTTKRQHKIQDEDIRKVMISQNAMLTKELTRTAPDGTAVTFFLPRFL